MYVLIDAESLTAALNIAKDAVDITKRAASPLYGHVMIEATDSGVYIRSFKTGMTVRVTVPGVVREAGSVLLPYKQLRDLSKVSKLEYFAIKCVDGGTVATLSSNDGATTGAGLKTLPVADFPTWRECYGVRAVADGKALSNALKVVEFAAAKEFDEKYPMLTAVNLRVIDNVLTLTGSDGYRVSTGTVPVTGDMENCAEINIQGASLKTVAKRLKTDTTLYFDGNSLVISDEHTVTRLYAVEGKYNDVGRSIPTAFDTRVRIEAPVMLAACKQAAIFANCNALVMDVRADADMRSGTMILSTKSPDIGDYESTPESAIDGLSIRTAFNVQWIMDFLKTIGNEPLVIELATVDKPAAFSKASEPAIRYYIQPMSV